MEMAGMAGTGLAMGTVVMAGMPEPVLMEMEEMGEAAAKKEVMEETAATVTVQATVETAATRDPAD